MIEPRVYRAAFFPALLVLVLVLFSFESRPPPLPQGLAADVIFDGRLALAGLRDFAARHPDRRPGTRGAASAAAAVAAELRRRGFETSVDDFSSDDTPLENVVGVRPGASREQVVLMAARDGRSGSADTAALLEIARVFSGRATRKTIVLVSTDGSTLGEAGARRFGETAPDRGAIQAVLAISNLAAPRARGPVLIEWAGDSSRVPIALQRTAAASLRQELSGRPGQEPAIGQLIRMALPLGLGAQGPLLEQGLPALRLSGSGELPPPPVQAGDTEEANRLGELGRSALRFISAVDAGPAPEPGPDEYVTVTRQLLPGWVISILALSLVLPALVGSIDAFARARRRREPVARWWRWLAAWMLPFLAALGAAQLLAIAGLAPGGPGAPPPPAQQALGRPEVLMILVVVSAAALAWLFGRFRVLRPRGQFDASSPGAACAFLLVSAFALLAVWLANPYTALLLAPTVHLWMLAVAPRRRSRDGERRMFDSLRVRLVLASIGLAVPIAMALFYMQRLALGPLDAAWYAFLLLVGGHVGILAALMGTVFLGLLGSLVSILVAWPRRRPPAAAAETRGPTVRGPASYAGPGSLGGTDSALRR